MVSVGLDVVTYFRDAIVLMFFHVFHERQNRKGFRGLTKHSKGLKHRKGATKDLLNTTKYDKGPDNPKPSPNSKALPRFLLWYDFKSFVVLCGV